MGCLAARLPVVAVEINPFQLQQFQFLASQKEDLQRRFTKSRDQLSRLLVLPPKIRQLAALPNEVEHDGHVLDFVDQVFTAISGIDEWDAFHTEFRKGYEKAYQEKLDRKAKDAAEKAEKEARKATKAAGACFLMHVFNNSPNLCQLKSLQFNPKFRPRKL